MIALTDFSSSLQPTQGRSSGTTASREAARYDAELVRRCNAGDDTAFVEIMTRYRARIFSVAYAMLRNHADAEEIVQDTFVRAHRALAKFRGDSSLATWLHHIALNLARNRHWYFFRRQRHATLSLDCALSEESLATFSDLVASDAAGPDRQAAAEEFTDLVATCMERLEAGPREILILRNAENQSYDEIARKLSLNVGTVKSRIARARESLRALLVEACPEFDRDSSPSTWFAPARPAGGVKIACA